MPNFTIFRLGPVYVRIRELNTRLVEGYRFLLLGERWTAFVGVKQQLYQTLASSEEWLQSSEAARFTLAVEEWCRQEELGSPPNNLKDTIHIQIDGDPQVHHPAQDDSAPPAAGSAVEPTQQDVTPQGQQLMREISGMEFMESMAPELLGFMGFIDHSEQEVPMTNVNFLEALSPEQLQLMSFPTALLQDTTDDPSPSRPSTTVANLFTEYRTTVNAIPPTNA